MPRPERGVPVSHLLLARRDLRRPPLQRVQGVQQPPHERGLGARRRERRASARGVELLRETHEARARLRRLERAHVLGAREQAPRRLERGGGGGHRRANRGGAGGTGSARDRGAGGANDRSVESDVSSDDPKPRALGGVIFCVAGGTICARGLDSFVNSSNARSLISVPGRGKETLTSGKGCPFPPRHSIGRVPPRTDATWPTTRPPRLRAPARRKTCPPPSSSARSRPTASSSVRPPLARSRLVPARSDLAPHREFEGDVSSTRGSRAPRASSIDRASFLPPLDRASVLTVDPIARARRPRPDASQTRR